MQQSGCDIMRVTSLFLESGYSFNGSNVMLESLLSHAQQEGLDVVALTDTKMHNVYAFYQSAKALGIDAIIGLQVKLEPLLDGAYIHLTCYAQNGVGFKNLLKLSSLQSFHQTLSFELLKKYLNGVSIVVGVHEGEIYQYLEDAHHLKIILNEIKTLSKDTWIAENFNIEMAEQSVLPSLYVDFVRYRNQEDYRVFKALKKIFQLPMESLFESQVDACLKPKAYFERLSEVAVKQLDDFIDKHLFELALPSPQLPRFKDTQGLSSEAYLRALAMKGLKKRLKHRSVDEAVYLKRLKEELSTIHTLGYDDYFLIVWDVVRFAKSEGYLVGPGRGSAPGSLVAYCLGITDIDPIKFNLLFERFLNKARQTMPDIDIDFPDYAREAVIAYANRKYGQEFVAYICTFGTFLKRSALRDSARVFEIEAKYVNEIVKRLESYEHIAAMVLEDKDVQNRMAQHDQIREWLEVARKIEGLPKHVGTHAAGVVLSHEPIVEYTAIQPGLNDSYQTQYAMEDLERIGLLKMDFLGLRNLTMIETIVRDIAMHTNETLNMYHVPLDDAKTFKYLREGSTTGIFQLESPGMRRLIKDMQIRDFNDIVVILALYRPGPMESIPVYLRRRSKKEAIEVLHESLKPILEPTEGILLYQEQIMAIASSFAGYTMQEADLLRRAVSKKDRIVLETERERFVEKSVENDMDEKLANNIYDYIVKFANYGFNKSHSVAYALISYWMAYLKANYPAYFIGVLMQNALSSESLMREYIQEALQLGITVKGPDIRISHQRFVFQDNCLYYPLTGIKNVGKSVLNQIEHVRKEKPFAGFGDFIARTKSVLNKRAYQYLIYAGACDCFGLNKRMMVENIEALMQFLDYQGFAALDEFVFDQYDEFNNEQLKHFEKEALGITLKYDPLSRFMHLYKKEGIYAPSDIADLPMEKKVILMAVLGRIKTIKTKKGDAMAFLSLEDKTQKIDAVCFPGVYKHVADRLVKDAVLYLKGTVERKQEKRQFIVEDVKQVE